jgi:hypothetical protein
MNAPSSRRVGFLSSGPEIPRFRLGTPCSTRTRYDPWIYHEADPITSVATNFSGSSLGFVDTLRQASFTGGTLHGASLGLFVGATSIAARREKALPRWISWPGIVQATLAILSLASLVFFPAALLILLGRVLGFVWCIAVGLMLAFDKQRGPGAEG